MTFSFPSPEQMREPLERLAAHRDGIVLVAILADEAAPDFANCSIGFFDENERAALKSCLVRLRTKRSKREAAKQREAQSC